MASRTTSKSVSGLTALTVGTTVASVRLQALLAADGRVEVWRGMWPDGRTATVHALAADATKLERDMFQNGARKLVVLGRRKRIRGLVSVAAVVPSTPAYVTRTAARTTLSDLPTYQWGLDRTISCVTVLATAMQDIHRAAFVHGSLHPSCILMDQEQNPSISDVGVMSLNHSYGRNGGHEHAHGPYAAPEVLQGERPGTRSDIYSFGRVLLFALTASTPTIDDEAVPELAELERVPEGLSRIVRRCTLAAPAERYPTFEDVVRDLANYQDAPAVGIGLRHSLSSFGRASGVDRASSVPPELSPATRTTMPPHSSPVPSVVPPTRPDTSMSRSWSHPIERFDPTSDEPPSSGGGTLGRRAAASSGVDGRHGGPASERRSRQSGSQTPAPGTDELNEAVDLSQLDEQLRSAGRVSKQRGSLQPPPSQPELSQLHDSDDLTERPLPLTRTTPLPPNTLTGPPSWRPSVEPPGASPNSGAVSGPRSDDAAVSGRSAALSGPYASAAPVSGSAVAQRPSWMPPKTQPSGMQTPGQSSNPRPGSNTSIAAARRDPGLVAGDDSGDLLTVAQGRLVAVAGLILVVGALGYSYARANATSGALLVMTLGAVMVSFALPKLGESALLSRLAGALLFGAATWLLNPTGEVADWARKVKLTRGSAQERGMRIKRMRDKGELSFGGVDLRATDFSGMDLSHAKFEGCNLRGAKFRGTILRGTSLANANVTGADFSGADLEGVDISAIDGWRSSTCDNKTSVPAPWICQRGLPIVDVGSH